MACRMKLIALLSAASALLLPTTAAGGAPQFTTTSRFDSVGTASAREGKVEIKLREVHADASGARGPKHFSVLVLFEPTSGAFSWRLQVNNEAVTASSWSTSEFNSEQGAFFKDGEIVDFWALMFRVYIRDYHGRASSIDDAETKALGAASQSVESGENLLGNGQDMSVVSLAAISNDFIYPPGNTFPAVLAPKVTNVRWDGDKQHWIVTLQARWKEEVTLDADYKLVSMKKVE